MHITLTRQKTTSLFTVYGYNTFLLKACVQNFTVQQQQKQQHFYISIRAPCQYNLRIHSLLGWKEKKVGVVEGILSLAFFGVFLYGCLFSFFSFFPCTLLVPHTLHQQKNFITFSNTCMHECILCLQCTESGYLAWKKGWKKSTKESAVSVHGREL